jgi:hypothetical protein
VTTKLKLATVKYCGRYPNVRETPRKLSRELLSPLALMRSPLRSWVAPVMFFKVAGKGFVVILPKMAAEEA